MIIFLYFGILQLPAYHWYRFLQRPVYIFRQSPLLRFVPGIFRPVFQGQVRSFTYDSFDRSEILSIDNGILTSLSGDFPQKKALRTVTETAEKYFMSPCSRDIFIKFYSLRLYDLCVDRLVVSTILRAYPGSRVRVNVLSDRYPDADELTMIGPVVPIPDGIVRKPLTGLLQAFATGILEKARHILVFFALPLFILLKIGIPAKKAAKTDENLVGIRVYKNDWAFYHRFRTIDFLVNGQCINAQNTVFCCETEVSPDYKQALEERKYKVIHVRESLRSQSFDFIQKKVLSSFFPFWLRVVFLTPFIPVYCTKTLIEASYTKLTWEALLENHTFRHYVVYNDFLPKDISRNLVMGRQGVETWYYVHSSHTPDYFTPKGQHDYRSVHFAYLHYDHLVSWGNSTSRYYQSHPASFKEYHNVGCIWSEHVVACGTDIAGNPVYQALKKKLDKTGYQPGRVISVFDTSFGGISPLTSADINLFCEGVLRLLDDFPDTAIIFKMKFSWKDFAGLGTGVEVVYRKIHDHPRCLLVEGLGFDSSDVLAISDLVLSACFTSPTIEALGAAIPALYYDPAGKFRDYYYDRFPHFVAHSYPELLRYVRDWINKKGTPDFSQYLDTYLKGEIDAEVDGNGITRFRALLCKTHQQGRKS